MSVFVLKLIAVLSMVTDHISYVLTLALNTNTPFLFNMRAIGRMAFPIYAFLLVNGFENTRSKEAYLGRLFLFAFISQFPFSLAFSQKNYMRELFAAESSFFINGDFPLYLTLAVFALVALFLGVYGKRVEKELLYIGAAFCLPLLYVEACGITLLGMQLNVFYTLAVSFAVIWAADMLIKGRSTRSIAELLLVTAACAAMAAYILPRSDYGFKGLLLIAALYLSPERRWVQPALTAVWAVWMYGYSHIMLLGALAACIPIALYNGELGRKIKLGFYLVYPLHLTALFFLASGLS